jgi:phosphatidylglycerophosphate synthase
MSRTLREWWYGLLEPLAGPLLGLHPNTISTASLVMGVAAGVAFALTGHHQGLFLVGAGLVLLSGVADCFDGIVARRTGQSSPAGDFLDHFYDRLVDVAVLGGLALAPSANTTLGLWATIMALLNSSLGTQIVASYGRRHYGGLGKGQLFALLVAVAVVLGVAPDLAVVLGGRRVGILDLFFTVVCGGAVVAIAGRIRLGLRLGREAAERAAADAGPAASR